MPDIALAQPGYFCTLAKVMTYTRSGTPDFSVPLSREELRVFTAIRGETSLEAVLVKTRLDPELIEDVMANLVARGLIVPSNYDRPSQPVSAAPPPVSRLPDSRLPVSPSPVSSLSVAPLPDSPRTVIRWAEQYAAVETFLRARVGGSEAETYISQLQNCASEQAFLESTRSIARRLALIVDANVGKQLLALVGNS